MTRGNGVQQTYRFPERGRLLLLGPRRWWISPVYMLRGGGRHFGGRVFRAVRWLRWARESVAWAHCGGLHSDGLMAPIGCVIRAVFVDEFVVGGLVVAATV